MPGWQSLIVCNETSNNGSGCGFGDLLNLAKAVMTDLTILATLMVTIAAIYIGFKLLTSQGNMNAMKEAKSMAGTILLGYVWILVAWVVVYTISSALLAPGFSLLSGIK